MDASAASPRTILSRKALATNAFVCIRKVHPFYNKEKPHSRTQGERGQASLGYTAAPACPQLNSVALGILCGLLTLKT